MNLFRLVLPFILLTVAWKLPGQISGRVFDAEAQAALRGAVISYGEEQTLSGLDGSFSLPPVDSMYILISHLGYQTDTLKSWEFQTTLLIQLKPDYTQLEQVIIKGPLFRNSLINLPSSIALFSKSELNQTTPRTYMEGLNRLPGVFVHSGTLSTNRVTIRGIGSRTPYGTNRVKAYFNDIPLTSGDGTTNLEDIDASMINTLEVIKGAKSAVYGSGLGGIIMLSGREYLEEGFHGKAALESGSFGTLNPQLRLQYKKGKYSTSAAYSLNRSNGWRQNSAYYRHSLHVYTSRTGERNKTDMLLHFIDMKAFIPSSLNEETFNNAPESAAPNWLSVEGYEAYTRLLTGIRNEFRISDKISNRTVLYLKFYNGYESRPFNILDDDALQGGVKSLFVYTGGAWRFRTGAELMLEKYNWQIFETLEGEQGNLQNSFSETRNPLSLFAHGAYSFSNGGTLEAGLSYNFLKYEITDHFSDSTNHSGNYKYTPVLSPFIGVNLPVGRLVHLYASIGHGFSYPGVEETLLPDGEANPDLKPESGINFEVGSRLSAINGRLFADVNIYLMLVKDLLVTERESEDAFYGINAGKTQHAGIEASASFRLNENSRYLLPQTRIDLSFTISENRFTEFTDDEEDFTSNALPGVPSSVFFVGVSLSYPFGLYANIRNSYTGNQYLDDGNTGSYRSYNLVHLKLGYKLPGKKLIPDFYFGIQNLFNSHYASGLLINAPSFGGAAPRYYYPGMPRNFYLGASVTF